MFDYVCVRARSQGTLGAQLHPELELPPSAVIVPCAANPDSDSSACAQGGGGGMRADVCAPQFAWLSVHICVYVCVCVCYHAGMPLCVLVVVHVCVLVFALGVCVCVCCGVFACGAVLFVFAKRSQTSLRIHSVPLSSSPLLAVPVLASVDSAGRNRLVEVLRALNPREMYIAGMMCDTGVRSIALELNLAVPTVYVIEDACWYGSRMCLRF